MQPQLNIQKPSWKLISPPLTVLSNQRSAHRSALVDALPCAPSLSHSLRVNESGGECMRWVAARASSVCSTHSLTHLSIHMPIIHSSSYFIYLYIHDVTFPPIHSFTYRHVCCMHCGRLRIVIDNECILVLKCLLCMRSSCFLQSRCYGVCKR